jgi:hypothetical protein
METDSWDEVEGDLSNATTVNERGETTNTKTIVQSDNETSDSETTSDSGTAGVIIQESDSQESDNQVEIVDDDEDDELIMTTKSADTPIRVVMFSGKKDEFDPWYEKQLARAKVKGFKGFLLNTEGDIPESDTDIDGDTNLSDDDKKELKKEKGGK